MKSTQIALLGNPNCGKTTVFNALTGARQRVGNWPGVTVEKKTGRYVLDGTEVTVVDLPGTYSLETADLGVSEDERIAREYAIDGEAELIVNVIDAANLQRNLYLTFQLLDLGRPMLVVLNMMDAVAERGEALDVARLEQALGCPVVPITASRNRGVAELKAAILEAAQAPRPPRPENTLGTELADRLAALAAQSSNVLRRWDWLEALQDMQPASALSADQQRGLAALRRELAEPFEGEIDIAVASARYEAIDALCQQVVSRPKEAGVNLTERPDRLALHRWWGVPVFFGVMYLMFLLAINVGSAFIDFFDILTGTLLVDGVSHVMNGWGAPQWLTVFIAQGLGGGIQTVSTFIPVIAMMFLCLSFLEDSGYLARAAMVVDRVMRLLGLPGKAFVPMLVGFGCNVPAIMGTRTLDTTRDRLLSVMMIPYMSCGARLPVYALFAVALFPHDGQNVVFGLYLTGIAVAAATGLILKHTLLPGEPTPFVMELPPYRLPTLKGLLIRSWDRLKGFVIRAGRAIVVVVMLLNVFNSLGTDGSFGNENTEKSLLATAGRSITPVFEPMGVREENWPATVGIFTGIFAKEAVVGTLDALYTGMAKEVAGEEEAAEPYSLTGGIASAFATIPEKLGELRDAVLDPLGLGGIETVTEDQAVHASSITMMQALFGSAAAGIAYLLFVLLYVPCVAAIGAVYREVQLRWTLILMVWSFTMAWSAGTLYYQIAFWAQHPASSSAWIGSIVLALLLSFGVLRWIGQRALPVQRIAPRPCAAGACECN